MANPNGTKKNLKVPSSIEARINGSKGGKQKAANDRRNTALAIVLKEFLNVRLEDIKDKGIQKLLATATGAKDMNKTIRELLIEAIVLAALNGNSSIVHIILELLGEDPVLKLRKQELALKKKALKAAEKQGVETSSAMQQLVDSLKAVGE